MIRDELVEYGKTLYSGQTVTRAAVGINFTAVELSDGTCGVSQRIPSRSLITASSYAGKLSGLSAVNLLNEINGMNFSDISLGIATLNALSQNLYLDRIPYNVIDVLALKKSDSVALVGEFKPMQKFVLEKTEHIYPISDRNENISEGSHPFWSMPSIVPHCNIVFVTGMTILDNRIDQVLNLAKNAEHILIIGPTAIPAIPVFKRYGVTMIGGASVTNNDLCLALASQGGGNTEIYNCTERYTIKTGL